MSATHKTKLQYRASGADERRTITISVRLGPAEAAELDARRGKIQRGTYLRLSLQGITPAQIPAINAKAYSELARLAANLNQLVAQLRCNQILPDIRQVYVLLQDLRQKIIGAAPNGGKKSNEV